MALNADWHRAHPMPKNPTEAQRVVWHSEHASACGCRELPPPLRALVNRYRKSGALPEKKPRRAAAKKR